jgi:hypothetical protein
MQGLDARQRVRVLEEADVPLIIRREDFRAVIMLAQAAMVVMALRDMTRGWNSQATRNVF